MHEIFISYRQDDSAAWAVLLRDAMVERFGERHVYLDKDSQRAGDWRTQIEAGLSRSKVVLLPIGPRWLDARSADGRRRLDDPDDVHRWEVAKALSMPGVTVIPVLVDRAQLPSVEDLNPDLRSLPAQQYREVAHDIGRREVDIARLVADVERATGLRARKPGPAGTSWLGKLGLLAASFVATWVVLTIADQMSVWTPLTSGEKVAVFVCLVAVYGLIRRLIKGSGRRD